MAIVESYLYYDLNNTSRFGPFLERWLTIKDFEDSYEVSDYGRIKSYKNGILKLNREKDSYTSIRLTDSKKDKFRRVDVHILVGEHFIPNPENKKTINHKLGFKDQNFVGEIEWNTQSENSLHAFRVLKTYTNPNNHMKKTFICIYNGIEKEVIGIRQTARTLNIPYQAIQQILKGKITFYNGFTFKNKPHHAKPTDQVQ
jgi:NUMOD4 motif-containing protein